MFSAVQMLRSCKPCAVIVRGEKLENIHVYRFSSVLLGTAEPGSAGAKVQSPEADNAKYVPILVIAPPSS